MSYTPEEKAEDDKFIAEMEASFKGGPMPTSIGIEMPVEKKTHDYDCWLNTILSIPEEIKILERKIQALTNKKIGITNRMKEIERQTFYRVSTETDAEGKKRFTNETMRETETQNRLKDNTEFQVFQEEQEKVVQDMVWYRQEADCLKMQFKSYELGIELQKIKLRLI